MSTILSLVNVSVHIGMRINQSFATNKSFIHDRVVGAKIVRTTPNYRFVKSLSNITLDINQGDRIGLMGHNGSGKTTLLKLLSGIYGPSMGSMYGKPFEPLLNRSFLVSEELSGIDAIKAHYLVNSSKASGIKLNDCIDMIDKASGLGEFLRFPIRTYSSGMAERLMFCLTTLFSHRALAIDEGFGTADAAFQGYAEKVLNDYLNKADCLVMASHSLEMLRSFCNRGLVLKSGQIAYYGALDESIDFYATQADR